MAGSGSGVAKGGVVEGDGAGLIIEVGEGIVGSIGHMAQGGQCKGLTFDAHRV